MHLAKLDLDLYLTRKRERRAAKKRRWLELRRVSRLRAEDHRRSRAGVFGAKSVIAEMLGATAHSELDMPQTSLHLKVPKTFSMLDAPEDAISLIASLALTYQSRPISDIYVDLSNITSQDLGAHALLDKLVDEITAHTKFRNGRLGWKGNFPRDLGQRRFIAAMGIIRQLGLTHKYLEFGDAEKIHLFERRCRHYIRQIKPVKPEDKTEQANAAERFANHVNRCLAREGLELTLSGRSQLCSYVVEVIDNAESHAGMVDWTIQGYVDMSLPEPKCEIVIFNFGKSIAATLDEMPAQCYTRQQIQKYLDLHARKGWFGPRWRREDLLTLIALQSSVSCRNLSEETTRGQGTADLIEFFQLMNEERQVETNSPASMYIVSGGTRILFDPRYRMRRNEDGSRRIAFNAENDLNQPPDPECVMPLQGCNLPGTLIGIKFELQASLSRPTDRADGV